MKIQLRHILAGMLTATAVIALAQPFLGSGPESGSTLPGLNNTNDREIAMTSELESPSDPLSGLELASSPPDDIMADIQFDPNVRGEAIETRVGGLFPGTPVLLEQPAGDQDVPLLQAPVGTPLTPEGKDAPTLAAASRNLLFTEPEIEREKVDYSVDEKTHPGRNGPLTQREMRMARTAWRYFENFTQETTGMANSVGAYPSTTLWDTASYLSGMVAAYELGIIDKYEFDKRAFRFLKTMGDLDLFRKELPNKAYHTKTGAKVNYANKAGEIGYSALDIGRYLVWMRILKNRYPYLGNSIDHQVLGWNYCNVIDDEGGMVGTRLGEEDETLYVQEGRLGYQQYASKGFGVWGFKTMSADSAHPYALINIFDVDVPYDSRDPRIFHAQNYVVTEGYILDGMELNWDQPDDTYSSDFLHTQGWRAEFAYRIYKAQQKRYEHTGFMTARSEHQIKGPPYFVYDTIYSGGHPWNTITPRGVFEPDLAAISIKAAVGMWSLWDTEYTDLLYDAISELYDPEKGYYEGLFEKGTGPIEIHTANNNGILMAGLLHKVQGKILKPPTDHSEVWYTAFHEYETRKTRCLPDPQRYFAGTTMTEEEERIRPIAMDMEDYQYCRPVPAEEWYPGCVECMLEPAASCASPDSEVNIVMPESPASHHDGMDR